MNPNEQEWISLRHILVQCDESYMNWKKNPNSGNKVSNNQLLNNFINKGFEQHESFLRKLLNLSSQQLPKYVGTNHMRIVAEITGIDFDIVNRRTLGTSNEPLVQYFRKLPHDVRQCFNATFVNDYHKNDEKYIQLISDLKNSGDEELEKTIFKMVARLY